MDPLRKVAAGQPLRIPAAAYNAFVNAARQAQEVRAETPARVWAPQPGQRQVLVKNLTGGPLDRFSVVGLGGPVVDPAYNLASFCEQPAVQGLTPQAAHFGRFAVLQVPLDDGAIGPAVVEGVTVCRLNVIDLAHGFAEIEAGVTSELRTGHAGSAEILWQEQSLGSGKWAVVRLGIGSQVVRFELLGNLVPGGSATARLPDDAAVTFSVSDTLGIRRGYGSPTNPGSAGYARYWRDAQQWEIIEMQPMALVLGALVAQTNGVGRTDATVAVHSVEVLQPIGGVLDSPPGVARNVLGLRLLDNDPVLLFWNESDQCWDAVGRDRGGNLRHAKVQTGWANQSADVRRSVTVVECDKDGNNETGDPFEVLTQIAPGQYTYLFEGDVVDYLEGEDGEPVIVSPHHDRPFGWIEWCAVDPTNIRPGWALCDGANGTADLRDRFVVGWRGGAGKAAKDRNGDAGDYAAIGETGGYAWHGASLHGEANNHPDHPNHRHQLDGTTYLTTQTDQGTQVADVLRAQGAGQANAPWTSGSDKLAGGADVDWAHKGSVSGDDTDNRPPYYCLAAIQRVS